MPPEAADPSNWKLFESWLQTQAPLWVLFCIFLYFIYRYGPSFLTAHIDFVKTSESSIKTLSAAYDRSSKDINELKNENERAFSQVSEAAKPFSRAIVALAHSDNKEEVKRHLDEMQKILDKLQ